MQKIFFIIAISNLEGGCHISEANDVGGLSLKSSLSLVSTDVETFSILCDSWINFIFVDILKIFCSVFSC